MDYMENRQNRQAPLRQSTTVLYNQKSKSSAPSGGKPVELGPRGGVYNVTQDGKKKYIRKRNK
jgi:hypothetical protein